MADIRLNPGESLIGRSVLLESCREFELKRLKIRGFTVGKLLLCIAAVTIWCRAGESYAFTGFPVKRLQSWLRQAGIREL